MQFNVEMLAPMGRNVENPKQYVNQQLLPYSSAKYIWGQLNRNGEPLPHILWDQPFFLGSFILQHKCIGRLHIL